MAAEVIAAGGIGVDVFDAMPSVGRKFLLAGRGGLNLTHAEPFNDFVSRYGLRSAQIEPLLADFGAKRLRDWAHDLGITTFEGTSQRVFPSEMKAAPLLRAWITRLRGLGVKFYARHRLQSWQANQDLMLSALQTAPASHRLIFDTPDGQVLREAQQVVFALGGASWSRLGSDGAWVDLFSSKGIAIAPLQASNCGFDVQGGWSGYVRSKFAGAAFKQIKLSFSDLHVQRFDRQGEFVLTDSGIEGSLIYAVSARLREQINAQGSATFHLDLLPAKTPLQISQQFESGRGSQTLSHFLRSKFGLQGVKLALLYELLDPSVLRDDVKLAVALKALPVTVIATRPIDEAISTAGGVRFEAMNNDLMLKDYSGIFCAGEMLDWEAPTGGYLLTAVMASGWVAGRGVLRQIHEDPKVGNSL